jgi:PKD repeat protein
MKQQFQIGFTAKFLCAVALLLLSASATFAQCSAAFNYSAVGNAGQHTFWSTSTGVTANTLFKWSQPNAIMGYGSNITYPFTANGVYMVTLTITDTASSPTCSSSVVQTITVSNANCGGYAAFQHTLMPGGLVVFGNYSSPSSMSYAWNFGDAATSTQTTPAHTYTANGTYTVLLSATSGTCNYTYQQVLNVVITSCSLTAGFTYSNTSLGIYNFINTTSGASNPYYKWSFGDGSNSWSANPTHTYVTNGTYTVMLLAKDTSNVFCTDSVSQVIVVTTASCTASVSFTLGQDSSQALTWNIYPNYPFNIAAASWSWGDGSSTSGLYPSHTFSAAGMYNICVSITVSCGSTGTFCSNSSIYRSVSNPAINVNVLDPKNVTGINVIDGAAGFRIYPNPASGLVYVSSNGPDNYGEVTDVSIRLMNLTGQVIYSEIATGNSGKLMKEIDLSAVADGTYFIEVSAGDHTFRSKVILLH